MEQVSQISVCKPTVEKIVVVVGTTGTGKSTLINILFNGACTKEECLSPAPVGASADSVTKDSHWYYNHREKTLYGDTVGFSDPQKSAIEIAMELKKFFWAARIGVHCIVMVMKFGRVTKEERLNMKLIRSIFNSNWKKRCIIVATDYKGDMEPEKQREQITKWLGDETTGADEEMTDFINAIGGTKNVILTYNNVNTRHESRNFPIRVACLQRLQAFLAACDNEMIVGPAPANLFEKLTLILEQWFSGYRKANAKKHATQIAENIFSNETVQVGSCPICYEDITSPELLLTPCNHAFHRMCIQSARLGNGGPCPICRAPLSELYEGVIS